MPKQKNVETDPVLRELKRARKSNIVRIKAHLLSEENQEKVRQFAEGSDEVTELEVQGSIGMGGLQRLSPVICKQVDNLKKVSLRANDLRLPAVLDLVCGLKLPSNNVLQLLDLSSNPIRDEGFKVLMSNVVHNTKLSALLLSKCSITDEGVVNCQHYIQHKSRPQAVIPEHNKPPNPSESRFYLNLSHNQIGAQGHTTIAKSLPSWMSLSLTRQRPPVLLPSSPEKNPLAAIYHQELKPIPLDIDGEKEEKEDEEEENVEEEETTETDTEDEEVPRRKRRSHVIPARAICRLIPVKVASGRTRTTVFHANPHRRLYLAEV